MLINPALHSYRRRLGQKRGSKHSRGQQPQQDSATRAPKRANSGRGQVYSRGGNDGNGELGMRMGEEFRVAVIAVNLTTSSHPTSSAATFRARWPTEYPFAGASLRRLHFLTEQGRREAPFLLSASIFGKSHRTKETGRMRGRDGRAGGRKEVGERPKAKKSRRGGHAAVALTSGGEESIRSEPVLSLCWPW